MAPTNQNYHPNPIILELGSLEESEFFDVVDPADFPEARERFFNHEWAKQVGLGSLTDVERLEHFSRFKPLPRNLARPLALRYHGHQFRNYNPNLGDGRGFLYAQLDETEAFESKSVRAFGSARTLDLGTKGSGKTPYSRGGDGRLTLKGAVREALATEMLESLGVNTSKSFSFFETGESLIRHDEPSPTRGAVLTRLSHGHIRFGTFQRLAFHSKRPQIEQLIQYCLEHYYPEVHSEISALTLEERATLLLREVTLRSADLTAQWMMAGFVHGVLNTDNMNISGESFDYGPYRFLPTYQPDFTAAYFDQSGLYAYGRQPESVLWNLQQLASSLALIAPADDPAESLTDSSIVTANATLNKAFGNVLGLFAPRFNASVILKFMERLGLQSQSEDLNDGLLMATFQFLASSQIGFEQFFHDWYGARAASDLSVRRASPAASRYTGEEFNQFLARIENFHPSRESELRLSNMFFQKSTPCTLLIDEIERIWDLITSRDDWSGFNQKVEEIREMGRVYGRR